MTQVTQVTQETRAAGDADALRMGSGLETDGGGWQAGLGVDGRQDWKQMGADGGRWWIGGRRRGRRVEFP